MEPRKKNGVVVIPEKIVQAQSLDDIQKEWANKLNILPEEITLEVIEKPTFFSRQWKVRLSWNDLAEGNKSLSASQFLWDGTTYRITVGEGVKGLRPYSPAGRVLFNGVVQDKPFAVAAGDQVEFQPFVQEGHLTWELKVRFNGLSVAAEVKHELAGSHILKNELPVAEILDLAQCVTWQSLPGRGVIWDEAKLKEDLAGLKVVHGVRPGVWTEIMAVRGSGEVVVANAILPTPSEHAKIENLICKAPLPAETEKERIDFFASKIKVVEEGDLLARKIPGREGSPGKDVFGKVLPAPAYKDVQLRPKKNVYLSEDGLEVRAACAGQPLCLDERTYAVENVFVLDKDVDLETGSVEFPGDVIIKGNVQDGLRVIAGGKLEIWGSVSHAEIKAEKGAKIQQNLLGGKVVIGEKFVIHSELLRLVSDLQERLSACLQSVAEVIKSPGAMNLKPGQCLKLVIERQFPDLPKLSARIEKFVLENKDDKLITEGLIVSIRTAKHFLSGLGPIDLQSLPFLQRVNQALEQFTQNLSIKIPEKLSLTVSYVQGTNIDCGGSFECQKGTYNAVVRVEGDVTIEGVCRGGKIYAGGTVRIRELGGSEVSSTLVQISPNSRLSVDYCHANVIIVVGKEIVQLEEDYRKLEVYRENGRVQVEKIRANPL